MAERLTAALSSGLASSSSSSSSSSPPPPSVTPSAVRGLRGHRVPGEGRHQRSSPSGPATRWPCSNQRCGKRRVAADGLNEFNMGDALAAGSSTPFKRFRVVARPQILTDGLLLEGDGGADAPPPLSSASTGPTPAPSSARRYQHLLANGNDDAGASSGDAATAAAAAPPMPSTAATATRATWALSAAPFPGTYTFAESWDALDKTVEELPKDAPVYTFARGHPLRQGQRLPQAAPRFKRYRLQHGIIGTRSTTAIAAIGQQRVTAASTRPSQVPTLSSTRNSTE